MLAQQASRGGSTGEIHRLALRLAEPTPELSWLDVGCGTGVVLRKVKQEHEPAELRGADVIDWLDDDLRDDVQMCVGEIYDLEPADRVLMIEVIEHMEMPWASLRVAARAVKPGGLLVLTTPAVANLRNRLNLFVRGSLSSFRPDNEAHLNPILPHVVERILEEEGLTVRMSYGAKDMVPGRGGQLWPDRFHQRFPQLTSLSLAVVGAKERGTETQSPLA